MFNNKIHFVYGKDTIVAYFVDTKRFFKVNEKAVDFIKSVFEKVSDNDIKNKFKISDIELEKYKNIIKESCTNEICNTNEKRKNELSRLVIHLTNDCNLRCQYCYANGGVYYSDKDLLNEKTADKILEYFYRKFDSIKSFQLFGGEPLMNMHMLNYICHHIREVYHDTEATIGLVTNGTLIDDDFIDSVKKYNINVTVSYDGNEKVNDILRVFPNLKGTSKIILENVKKLKTATNQPNTIEVTYTKYHIDNNVTILDIIKHLYKEVPNTAIHLVPAGGNENCAYSVKDLSVFADSVDSIMNENKNNPNSDYSYSLLQRILFGLSHKDSNIPYICDAGIGTLSVSVKGNIYPCFMFTDINDLCLGNINEDDPLTSERTINMLSDIKAFNFKETNDTCKNCFIKALCSSCMGLNYMSTSDIKALDNSVCNMYRSMTERALLQLAEIEEVNNA